MRRFSGALGGWLGRARHRRSARSLREAGYNLVALAVFVTVLNIMVAKTLPLWSGVIQREKEAELIFRGMQYAEAIRIFEAKHGRLPIKLEELVEVEPRSIRRLWENPMNDEGKWTLIFQNTPTAPGQNNPDRNGRRRSQTREREAERSGFDVPVGGDEVRVGPIFGVYSQDGGEAIKAFVPNPNAGGGGGSTEISEWRFTVDLAKALVRQVDPENPLAPSMNAGDFGKPWPPGIRPQNLPTPGPGQGGRGRHSAVQPGGNQPGTRPNPSGGRGDG